MDEPGLVGLAFEPYRRGVRYPDLPLEGPVSRAGGWMEFQRLPAGGWIVARWQVRLPVTARS